MKTIIQSPTLSGQCLTHSPDKLQKTNSRKITISVLEKTDCYVVFADNLNGSQKLDLTKSVNIRGIFTSEDNAREFATTYSVTEGKLNFISLIFKIQNGAKLNINDSPLVVYCRTPYQCLFNYDTPAINSKEYHKYINFKKHYWVLQCLCC